MEMLKWTRFFSGSPIQLGFCGVAFLLYHTLIRRIEPGSNKRDVAKAPYSHGVKQLLSSSERQFMPAKLMC